MNKIILTIVVLAVVGISAYFLFFSSGSKEPAAENLAPIAIPTATPSATVSKTPAPASVSVNISNFAFNPPTLIVKKGTKVTWVNNDSAPHTVTSDSGSLLNSPTLALGQSFSFTFSNLGTFNYYCAIHPMMKGSVIVTN